MLKFKSIKGQGFGSLIKLFSFVFGNLGLKIIKGENGSGKTTSISLMAWTIYGNTLKGKNPETWKHLRPKNWNGTFGEVIFETQNGVFTVVRCKKWKGDIDGARGDDGLYFFKGNENISKHDKRSTQEAIIKELGMSFELFKNSIMFGQKMKRIINESGPVQSKVFEEAFEADFINIAKTNAEKERSDLGVLIAQVESDRSTDEIKLSSTKEYIKVQKELVAQFNENKNNRKSLIKKEIDNTDKEIVVLESSVKDYGPKLFELKCLHTEMEEDVDKESELKTKLNGLISKRRESILKTTKISRVCDKCGSSVSKSKIKEQEKELKLEQSKIATKIKKTESKIKKLTYKEDDLEQLEDKINKIEKKSYKVKLNIEQISKLTAKNSQRRKDIASISKETVNTKQLDKAKKRKKSLKRRIENLTVEIDKYQQQYDILNWCIKEPLSNKGLKAYIFDSQLKQVNDRLEELSEILPFKIEFGIDTDTKSKKFYTLVEMSGGVVPYEDLSGGEQQLVNIAIAFSIHDVVSEDVNALFMDEVFESLDQKNIEIVGDLILQKADSKEVLLVTHTSFYPTGAEIMQFTKNSKGVTKIS